MYSLINKGVHILNDWPTGLYNLLDQIEGQTNGSGLEKRFGSFYETWHKRFRTQEFSFMQKAIATYSKSHWNTGFLSAKNSRLFEDQQRSSQYIPLAQTIKLLKLHSAKVMALIDMGTLEAYSIPSKSRTLTLVTRLSLQGYLTQQQDTITAQDMRRMLGIGEKSAARLLEHGMVEPLPVQPLNRSRRHIFSKRDVKSFLEGYYGLPQKVPSVDTISLKKALRILSAKGMNLIDLLQAITKNMVIIYHIDKAKIGLHRLCFIEKEIRLFIQQKTIE